MTISGDLVLRTVAAEFAHYFYICERLFVLDARASQSREMRSLRTYLGEHREKLVQVMSERDQFNHAEFEG